MAGLAAAPRATYSDREQDPAGNVRVVHEGQRPLAGRTLVTNDRCIIEAMMDPRRIALASCLTCAAACGDDESGGADRPTSTSSADTTTMGVSAVTSSTSTTSSTTNTTTGGTSSTTNVSFSTTLPDECATGGDLDYCCEFNPNFCPPGSSGTSAGDSATDSTASTSTGSSTGGTDSGASTGRTN